MINDDLLSWIIGVVVVTLLFPLALQYLLSSIIQISVLEAWGLLSLVFIFYDKLKNVKRLK